MQPRPMADTSRSRSLRVSMPSPFPCRSLAQTVNELEACPRATGPGEPSSSLRKGSDPGVFYGHPGTCEALDVSRLEIIQFADDHIEGAGRLLADRHRRHR